MIKTWITTANGRESIKPNGPKMKVNPNNILSSVERSIKTKENKIIK